MSRQLLILRHAKSAWDTGAPTDFERPLAKRGRRDAPRMGKWMKSHKTIPDYVVASPAERARQTVIEVCKQMGIKKKKINFDSRIYGAGVEELLEVLAEAPKKAERVMIVGHNPGLEFLFHHLLGAIDNDYSESGLIKTATLVQLEIKDSWDALASGSGTTIEVVQPRALAAAE